MMASALSTSAAIVTKSASTLSSHTSLADIAKHADDAHILALHGKAIAMRGGLTNHGQDAG
jgi:hypothetical protein